MRSSRLAILTLLLASPALAGEDDLAKLDAQVRAVRDTLVPSLVQVERPAAAGGDPDPLTRWENDLDPEMVKALGKAIPPQAVSVDAAASGPGHDLGIVVGDGTRVLSAYSGESPGATRAIRLPDGRSVEAKVEWGDAKIGLSGLSAAEPLGKPVRLDGSPPEAASLMVLVPAGSAEWRLIAFNGAGDEPGILIRIDGSLAGVCGGGRIVTAGTLTRLVSPPLKDASLDRPQLGMVVRETPLSVAQPQAGGWACGLVVVSVVEGSPAASAGLQPGDVVLAIDGHPVLNIANLSGQLVGRSGAQRLTVLRDGQPVEKTVDLPTRPRP